MTMFAEDAGTAAGALFRIAQGIEDPVGAALLALEAIGATELAELARSQRAPASDAGTHPEQAEGERERLVAELQEHVSQASYRWVPDTVRSLVGRLAAALRSAPPGEPTGWRPIESAPKDGTDVLLCTLDEGADQPVFVARWMGDDEFPCLDDDEHTEGGGVWWNNALELPADVEPVGWLPIPASTPGEPEQP